ncbi:MAG: response regulator [Myxococcota bacterium]|nr:response regulator [Myxococcota bacterium]
MKDRLLAWVDDVPGELDPATRARLRVQHLVVLLYVLIGSAYVAGFHYAGLRITSITLALVILSSIASLFGLSRRGRIELGGRFISVAFYQQIVMTLIARGGMQSNSAAWLLLSPVLASYLVGPRHAARISAYTVIAYLGIWGAEMLGVPMPEGLPPELLPYMPALDYPAIAFAMGVFLYGQASIWEGVVRDLDQTNQAMGEQVREREKAEREAREAAQARYTFLATMSHEIRTPLNGVLGLTEVLLDTPLDREQRDLASTVRSSGRLLRALLDDVLDYSKIDSGHLELDLERVDLHALVHELLHLWEPTAKERGLELRASFEPDDQALWVRVDANKLRQILGNLISNALKFTDQGYVAVELSLRGQDLRLQVRDTGIGISPQAQTHIFTAFKQADSTTTRRFGGTGLGLSISQRLAVFLSGQLRVESEVGVGSTFILDLPITRVDGPQISTTLDAVEDTLTGMRVLVAEDNPVNQMVITRLLEREGVTVQTADDGQQAIDAWKDNAPDAILMDCQMPVCDGYEATRQIRALGGTLPIVALTANSMPGDRARCIEAGMDEHLGKPIDTGLLARTLRKIWASQRSSA